MIDFNNDIDKCLEVLHRGGVILYPTDTIWGIGCDATNEEAVARVYKIKKRPDTRALIVLVADERELLKYVAHPDPTVFDYIENADRPTTVIFDGAIGLADNLVASDGSIGIRICKEDFCRHLIKRFRKPIVSTSANISGETSPANFGEVTNEIKEKADYVVQYRQDERSACEPSSIIKFKNGQIEKLR